jgi:hypothetical protein
MLKPFPVNRRTREGESFYSLWGNGSQFEACSSPQTLRRGDLPWTPSST